MPRIVFAGTPEFACRVLHALLVANLGELVGVYTQPDRPAGRGKHLQPSPVKQLALSQSLQVFQPATLRNPTAQQQLRDLAPDIIVVTAYGLLFPLEVLGIPRLGCVNVHASLLPRWRGAAPVERALDAGDSETGITIMQMDEGMDTGAILLQKRCAIEETETGDSLREKLSEVGAHALLEALPALLAATLPGRAQDGTAATYAPKLKREEALIDWQCDATRIDRRVRAFNSANVCHTTVDGRTLRIWAAEAEGAFATAAPGTIVRADRKGIRVACGSGVLRVTRLQLPGGKALDSAAMLNGHSELFAVGIRLGSMA